MTVTTALPTLTEQAERLISLGLHEAAGLTAADVLGATSEPGGLLVLHPAAVPASALVPLLQRAGKPGFVVEDLQDLDDFRPITDAAVPDRPLYVVQGLDRGDEMANWSPDEALPAIVAAGRTPLTINEGIQWLIQAAMVLERNRCFMTIGSRKAKGSGLDTRVPAIWISNGTGRDGKDNRNAPKVGWCWAGNRHTWLGFASAARRN